MGYRSDVRIRLTKEDFERLKKEFEEKLIKTEILNWNLFEHLDIYREEKDCQRFYGEDGEKSADAVYFGWNYLKWYDGYEDVEFIENFIFECKYYAFIRIGESMEGDIDSRADGFEHIWYSYVFDDDEGATK